jgi:hypothetical protein
VSTGTVLVSGGRQYYTRLASPHVHKQLVDIDAACPVCTETRTGSFRYCADCGFDYERELKPGPASMAPPTTAGDPRTAAPNSESAAGLPSFEPASTEGAVTGVLVVGSIGILFLVLLIFRPFG